MMIGRGFHDDRPRFFCLFLVLLKETRMRGGACSETYSEGLSNICDRVFLRKELISLRR